jgi:16S rRNA G966 N2-methylase RsmD
MSSQKVTIKDYFKKFYGMHPYLTIEKEEWDWIKKTWEKEEIVEEISEVLFTYPYPFPELTADEVLEDFRKLKGTWWPDILVEGEWFPRNENNSAYDLTFGGKPMFFKKTITGNKASNIFHIQTRHKVDWIRMPSPWKTWQTPKGIRTVVRAFFTLEQSLDMVNKKNIILAIQMRKYVPAQFKPAIAKAFYDYFKSENILDFSAGWGDRLCGFFASEYGKNYVGIDPNKTNTEGYKKQIEFYKKNKTFFENEKTAEMIESPAEDLDYSRFENFFDTVFTSPPYFNTEKYSYDDTQSWVRYKSVDDWNKNFLHKTLDKIIPTIKTNGILAINISDVYSSPDKGYVPIVNPMNDFLESKGLTYRGCIGMEMTKIGRAHV